MNVHRPRFATLALLLTLLAPVLAQAPPGVTVLSAEPLTGDALQAVRAGGAQAVAKQLGSAGYRVYWSGDGRLCVVAAKTSPSDLAPGDLHTAALLSRILESAKPGQSLDLANLQGDTSTWVQRALGRLGGADAVFAGAGAGWTRQISLASVTRLYLVDDRVSPPLMNQADWRQQFFQYPPAALSVQSGPRLGCALWYLWPHRTRGWDERPMTLRTGESTVDAILRQLVEASRWPLRVDPAMAGRGRRKVYVYGGQIPMRDVLWGLELLSGLRLGGDTQPGSWKLTKLPADDALNLRWWSSLPGSGYVNPALTARGRTMRANSPGYHTLLPAAVAWSLAELPPLYRERLVAPVLAQSGRDTSDPEKMTLIWLWGVEFEWYASRGNQGTGRGLWLPGA
ncbi:MAG TPA: hypothetical protein DCZ72_02590 [Armatimonadetes bacterium]|nr:hypothetical protein [Armatimonadota bacterium]